MSKPVRIVFAGTPDFAVPAVQALHEAGAAIVAVYTQPDRPAGRGRRVQPSPVKRWALEHAVPVEQPETLKDTAVQQQLSGYEPDLMVVAAYGLLLSPAVLAIPRLGCVNIHASLLPRWRGAAPVQRAILAGDAQTGISLMQMGAGLDTGPVLARAAIDIDAGETAAELHDRLAALGGELMADRLPAIAQGGLSAESQDEALACHAAKLSKAEAWLDWAQPADQLDRQVRAFNPWPIAQTGWNGRVLRIWRARPLDVAPGGAVPGQVIGAGADGVDVACGRGALRLTQMQLPGGKAMSAAELLNARSFDGAIFDPRPPAPDTRVRA